MFGIVRLCTTLLCMCFKSPGPTSTILHMVHITVLECPLSLAVFQAELVVCLGDHDGSVERRPRGRGTQTLKCTLQCVVQYQYHRFKKQAVCTLATQAVLYNIVQLKIELHSSICT